jgi:putative oxidoreductase
MIKKLLFKTTPESSFVADLGLTILRVSAGLLMAFLHGMGKFPVSEQLIQGVASLGFPMPTFFAWAAASAELIGAICLAVGFMTRPAALLLGITMLVAAFGMHLNDPWSTRELSFIYLVISIVFLTRGSGRFSIDHLIKA